MNMLALGAMMLLFGSTAEADFASRLHGQLAAKPGNLFYAPSSIRLALAMAYAGARGATAAEMEHVCGFSKESPAYFKGLIADWHDLASPPVTQTSSNDPETQKYYEQELERRRLTLRIANRLWGDTSYAFTPSFLAVLRDDYGAPLEQLNFRTKAEQSRVTINDAVAKQTEDKIKDLLPRGSVTTDTSLIITNAVYFKGAWSNPFQATQTRDGPFKLASGAPANVPLMHQIEHFAIADVGDAQILELPYADGQMAMAVILPKANSEKVEKELIGGALAGWLKKLATKKVDVTLPKFKTTGSFQLADALTAMGMKHAFKFKEADFSGMDGTRLLFIGSVVHQAYVDVNEAGTEAAAATALSMKAGAAPAREDPIVFRADHPFLFVIRDTRNQEILFTGRIVDPRK